MKRNAHLAIKKPNAESHARVQAGVPINIAVVAHTVQAGRLRRALDSISGVTCVCQCGSAAEAISRIPRSGVDIVLLGFKLHDSPGLDCARRLRKMGPELKIVMVTDGLQLEAAEMGHAVGVTAFLVMPVSLGQLAMTLRSVHHAGGPAQQRPCPCDGRCPHLKPEEERVLLLLEDGALYKEIAAELAVPETTVRNVVHRAYVELGGRNRSEAVRRWNHCRTCRARRAASFVASDCSQ